MAFKNYLMRVIDAVLPDPGQPVREAAFREGERRVIARLLDGSRTSSPTGSSNCRSPTCWQRA